MGAVWSVVELNMGIVNACVPTYRPLFAHLFHQTLNIGNESARANSDVTLIYSKGIQLKSFGKVRTSDTSGEKRVAIIVRALGRNGDRTSSETAPKPLNRSLTYRDLIVARGLDHGCSGFNLWNSCSQTTSKAVQIVIGQFSIFYRLDLPC